MRTLFQMCLVLALSEPPCVPGIVPYHRCDVSWKPPAEEEWHMLSGRLLRTRMMEIVFVTAHPLMRSSIRRAHEPALFLRWAGIHTRSITCESYRRERCSKEVASWKGQSDSVIVHVKLPCVCNLTSGAIGPGIHVYDTVDATRSWRIRQAASRSQGQPHFHALFWFPRDQPGNVESNTVHADGIEVACRCFSCAVPPQQYTRPLDCMVSTSQQSGLVSWHCRTCIGDVGYATVKFFPRSAGPTRCACVLGGECDMRPRRLEMPISRIRLLRDAVAEI